MIQRHALLLALTAVLLAVGCTRTPRDVRATDGKDRVKKEESYTPPKEGELLPAPRVEGATSNPLIRPSSTAGIIDGRVIWKGKIPLSRAKADECYVTIQGRKVAVNPPR